MRGTSARRGFLSNGSKPFEPTVNAQVSDAFGDRGSTQVNQGNDFGGGQNSSAPFGRGGSTMSSRGRGNYGGSNLNQGDAFGGGQPSSAPFGRGGSTVSSRGNYQGGTQSSQVNAFEGAQGSNIPFGRGAAMMSSRGRGNYEGSAQLNQGDAFGGAKTSNVPFGRGAAMMSSRGHGNYEGSSDLSQVNDFECAQTSTSQFTRGTSAPFGRGRGNDQRRNQMNQVNAFEGTQASSAQFGRGASNAMPFGNRGAAPSNNDNFEGGQNSNFQFGRGASNSNSFGRGRGGATGANMAPLGNSYPVQTQSASFGNRDNGPSENRGYGKINERGGGNFTQSRPAYGENQEQNDRKSTLSFIPKNRDIDAIFKDDEDRANIAVDLYEQDGQIIVENGPENLAVIEDWKSSGLSKPILENIIRSKYLKPRNFQKYAIPLILEGFDIKGYAETGNGKSAAFLLPIIHMLAKSFEEDLGEANSRQMKVSALIIEPTRELAKQLYEQASKFAHGTGVTVNFAYGAYNLGVNKQSLWSKGCDILIGTPGRLKHFLKDGVVSAELLQYLVLDEADRLLDFSFMAEVQEMTSVKGFPSVKDRQTLFFSATFGENTRNLANELCKKKSVLIKNKGSDVNSRIKQELINVPFNDRKEFLLNLFKSEIKKKGSLPKKLVFVETKRDADYIATMLSDEGIKAQTVNGDRTQELREAAVNGFRTGEFNVLVVTNVFARGMDFSDLGHVINLHLPTDRETYIHRIGRTGRLNFGIATSFFDPDHPSDRDIVEVIMKELENAGQEVPKFLRSAKDPFMSYAKKDEGPTEGAKSNEAQTQLEEEIAGFDF